VRRVELLIDQCRRSTDNQDFTDTTGIQDEEFLQYLNDAQERLQALILQQHPDQFLVETEIPSVAQQEAYTLPQDAYISSRVKEVWYSHSGNPNNYYRLKKGALAERVDGISSEPCFYLRRNNKLLLQPRPQSSGGLLRVLYQQRLPKLDKRRAVVSAVTLTGNEITSLTFDPTENIDDEALLEEGYISIVDKYGNVQMRFIPVTAIDTTTGVVTIEPGFEFEDGEEIEVGDYALRGTFSSSHSQLPETTERYLLKYGQWVVLKRDSNDESQESNQELKEMEAEIVSSFADPDDSVPLIPITDDQWFID